MVPVYERAHLEGVAARRAGHPREPVPSLEHLGPWSGARSLADFSQVEWDEEDERLAVEESRPPFAGEVEWRPVRRLRDASAN